MEEGAKVPYITIRSVTRCISITVASTISTVIIIRCGSGYRMTTTDNHAMCTDGTTARTQRTFVASVGEDAQARLGRVRLLEQQAESVTPDLESRVVLSALQQKPVRQGTDAALLVAPRCTGHARQTVCARALWSADEPPPIDATDAVVSPSRRSCEDNDRLHTAHAHVVPRRSMQPR